MNKKIVITIIGIIIIGIIYFGIELFGLTQKIKNNKSNPKDNIELIIKEPKPKTETAVNKDDCVFDLNTQTDDFLKEIPEFSNYFWDNEQKKATIKLDDGNTLIVTRGGCTHFAFYGNLLLDQSELNINNESIIFEKALWIAQRLFNKSDFDHIKESLDKKNFEIEQSENQKYYTFQSDAYCDMTLVVEKINSHQISIEIGYYLC